jgi:hypothetical protein
MEAKEVKSFLKTQNMRNIMGHLKMRRLENYPCFGMDF